MTTRSSEPTATVEWSASKLRLALHLYCDPVPASRPRVSKWGVYYGKTYKSYMQQADRAIPQADHTLDGNLFVDIEFACPKPKSTTRINPRGDIDNHIKSILDAITKKKYWHDDDQIVGLAAVKRWVRDGEEPHTRIVIERA